MPAVSSYKLICQKDFGRGGESRMLSGKHVTIYSRLYQIPEEIWWWEFVDYSTLQFSIGRRIIWLIVRKRKIGVQV